MDILKYVNDQALILIPVLYIFGMFIKNTPKIDDWLIPYILLVLGLIGSFTLLGISMQSAVQGILVSGAAVYANQLIKQGNMRGK